jgi:abequosyltransferase
MRLSICIPTYNFGAFIGETLESILPQLRDGVEVVVLDGGSTDDTEAVMRSFEQPSVRYHRQEERGGIDRDMARTVELAQGEYCWLFCADDVMQPGAVQHVLERLETGADLYLCGLTLCTLEMVPFKKHPIARIAADEEFDLSSAVDRKRYFCRAQTTTAFFSFAGSLIIKKASWDAVGQDERFVGSLWAHVARILQMIPRGLRLHFIPARLLHKRTGNDSFMDRGIGERYARAIDGYHRLACTFFEPDSLEARHIRRVVTNEFPPWVLLAAKLDSRRSRRGNEDTIDRIAAAAYGDPSLRNRFYRVVYKATPLAVFGAAQTVKRRLGSRFAEPSSAGRAG